MVSTNQTLRGKSVLVVWLETTVLVQNWCRAEAGVAGDLPDEEVDSD